MTLISGVRRDLLFLILAALLVAFYALQTGGGFPLDDSWIHQVYGRNLAQTGQWAFIPGEPSAASTSPLYTVLLSIGYRLSIDYVFWTHLLGTLALAGTAMLAARLADQINPGRVAPGLLAGLAVLLCWHLIWAAASGMETILFSMLTLALMYSAWRERADYNFVLPSIALQRAALRGAIFGVLAALTALARPEGVLLAGLAGLSLLVLRPKHLVLWIAGAAVGFGVTIAPYLLLNLNLTGGLLPNTAAAKWAQHAPLLALSYPTRLWDMTLPILVGGQALLIPGLVMYAVHVTRASVPRQWLIGLLPLLWIVGLIALYAARLPASYQHGRYVIPVLPAFVTIGTIGTLMLLQRTQRSLVGRSVVRALAISAALLFVFFALSVGADAYQRDVRIINEEMVAAAHWIHENVEPEALLAIHDIGAVGYFAPRPMIDIAGLVSPEVIPILDNPDALWEYIRQSGAQYLMAFPDQIPGDNLDDPRLCPAFVTNAPTARAVGGANMAVYALIWDESNCSSTGLVD